MFADSASDLPGASTSDADTEVVASCRDGDAVAWRRLYETHFDFAYRIARRLGLPESDVEDAVHEAFEIAFTRLDRFEHGQFSTWLFRIVANVVSGRLRRWRVRRVLDALWGQRTEPEAPSLEATVAARQQLEQVSKVLRSMSTEKREVFALHELEGLTHEEISVLTGTKVATVRTRLHYAKRDFERLWKKRGLS
jgi:RNA polymerase sigma-70 factor (ECF subfamily)